VLLFSRRENIITKVCISLFFNSLQDLLAVGLNYIIVILNIYVSIIDHCIEKCCRPTICKTDRECTSANEGITESCWVRLKKCLQCSDTCRWKRIGKTDLAIQLPRGCYGRIAPRSGLALHHHINVGCGVVDEDFQGNLSMILFNHSDKPFHIHRGDRVAQLICQRFSILILKKYRN
jgi:dUTP pyrophosphatase